LFEAGAGASAVARIWSMCLMPLIARAAAAWRLAG